MHVTGIAGNEVAEIAAENSLLEGHQAYFAAEEVQGLGKKRVLFFLLINARNAPPAVIDKLYANVIEMSKDLGENDSFFFVHDISKSDLKSAIGGNFWDLYSVVKSLSSGVLKQVNQKKDALAANPALEAYLAVKPEPINLETSAITFGAANGIKEVEKKNPHKAKYIALLNSFQEVEETLVTHPFIQEYGLPLSLTTIRDTKGG